MKDFSEFVASLDQEDMDFINGVSDDTPSNLSLDPSDPEIVLKLTAYASAQGFSMAIRLLSKYHEWLEQQLPRQSKP